MATEPALANALRPFERRAISVKLVEGLLVTALSLLLVAEIGLAAGVRSLPAMLVLSLIGMAGSAIYAYSRRPSQLSLARRIDARGRLNDLVITAVTCEGEGLPSLVRRSAIVELGRMPLAVAYPIEPPRFWRQALVVVFVAQAAVLPFVLRPPVERARPQDLTGLALPPAAGAAPSAVQRGADQKSAAAAPEAAQPASPETAAQRSGTLQPAPTPAARGGQSGAGASDRVRLATASADADIAAGRVPLARRAIVKRYFAAIENQRKRPR